MDNIEFLLEPQFEIPERLKMYLEIMPPEESRPIYNSFILACVMGDKTIEEWQESVIRRLKNAR
uniref:Uncharacterized protein n=1 Tax=Dulem virus 31 TaxID=3145749 RepID=A0AAU8AT88_9VIRU